MRNTIKYLLAITTLSLTTMTFAAPKEITYNLVLNAINIEPLSLTSEGTTVDTAQCNRSFLTPDHTSIAITFPADSQDTDTCDDVVILKSDGSFLAWISVSKSKGIVSAKILDKNGWAAPHKWCKATIQHANTGKVLQVVIDGKNKTCK